MVQLNFISDDGKPMGVLNWFAVHPTSMNNTNHLISGDNKGAASQMFEREMNSNYVTGKGPFVAAFASTNLGDISPNIKVIFIGITKNFRQSVPHLGSQMHGHWIRM